jgi:hypothetical protein
MAEEFQTWKEHFINQSKGLIPHERKFYKVSMQKGRGGEPTIKMVTPTEQVVERAKSKLTEPPNIYDPVTGVMQHTDSKHVKVKQLSRKRKYTTNKKKNTNSKRRKTNKKKSTLGKKRKYSAKKRVNKTIKKKKWWK